MALADEKVKEGSLIDAAEIARYVMTLTCAEYEVDHPYGETYGEVWWLRRKPLKEVLERARVMLTELLITGDDIDDDSQRGLMKVIVAECKPFKKSHICWMDDFLEDAQAKVLTPKRYEAWLRKKLNGMQGEYFKKPYLEKLVRLLDKSGRRNDAIEVMEAWKGSDDLRMLYIDILIGWKMYDEALEVMDLSKERGVFLEDYNQKTLDVLDMLGSRDKAIEVCKYRFHTVDRKQPLNAREAKTITTSPVG